MTKADIIVCGLDPGSTTGLALWDARELKFVEIRSMLIHEAMEEVRSRHARGFLQLVVFEDARQRKFFAKYDRESAKYGAAVREGAGAAKREATIWQDYLESIGVPYHARAPRGTKKKADLFQHLTGWTGRTNEHARDAAMVVHGLNAPMVAGLMSAHLESKRRAS